MVEDDPRDSKARNHAFVDGNKRTARVVTRAFLMYGIVADRAEQVNVWCDLAEGP